MRLWRGVSKSMFTCFLTEDRIYDYAVKLAAATSKRSTGVGNFREHFWRDRQPCLKERSDAQACIKLIVQLLNIREGYRSSQQQFLNANFVWNQDEVSQNSRYARRFYYSRQLSAQTMQHFDDSRYSFAKIAIPCTILSLAQFSASKNKRLLNGSVSGNLKASLSVGKHFIVQGFCNNERYYDMQAVNLKMVYSCSILCQ